MEQTVELKFIDSVMNDNNVKANKHLEAILKRKVAKKIADTLNQ